MPLTKGRDAVTTTSKNKVPNIAFYASQSHSFLRLGICGVRNRSTVIILGVDISAVLKEKDNSHRILLYPTRWSKIVPTPLPRGRQAQVEARSTHEITFCNVSVSLKEGCNTISAPKTTDANLPKRRHTPPVFGVHVDKGGTKI